MPPMLFTWVSLWSRGLWSGSWKGCHEDPGRPFFISWTSPMPPPQDLCLVHTSSEFSHGLLLTSLKSWFNGLSVQPFLTTQIIRMPRIAYALSCFTFPRALTISWYILLIYYLSPRLEWQLQERRDVCLPHRSIYCLEQGLAHRRCSVNICSMNGFQFLHL